MPRDVLRLRKWVLVGGLVLALAASAWLIAAEPAFATFALAVAVAIGWSIWVDRHPDASDEKAARFGERS